MSDSRPLTRKVYKIAEDSDGSLALHKDSKITLTLVYGGKKQTIVLKRSNSR